MGVDKIRRGSNGNGERYGRSAVIMPSVLTGRKIIVCDREQNLSIVYKRLLESEGFEVNPFTDIFYAWQAFEHNRFGFDVAIIDISTMNKMGMQLAKDILSLKKICRLFLSLVFMMTPWKRRLGNY